jgi:hypothetical protein
MSSERRPSHSVGEAFALSQLVTRGAGKAAGTAPRIAPDCDASLGRPRLRVQEHLTSMNTASKRFLKRSLRLSPACPPPSPRPRPGRVVPTIGLQALATFALSLSLLLAISRVHAQEPPSETPVVPTSGKTIAVALDGSGDVATIVDKDGGQQVLSAFHTGEVYDEIRGEDLVVYRKGELLYTARKGPDHYVVWTDGRSSAFAAAPAVYLDRKTKAWTAYGPTSSADRLFILFDKRVVGVVTCRHGGFGGVVQFSSDDAQNGRQYSERTYAPEIEIKWSDRDKAPMTEGALQTFDAFGLRASFEKQMADFRAGKLKAEPTFRAALMRSGPVAVPADFSILAASDPKEARIVVTEATVGGKRGAAVHQGGKWTFIDRNDRKASPSIPVSSGWGGLLPDGSYAGWTPFGGDLRVEVHGKTLDLSAARMRDSGIGASAFALHPRRPLAAFVITERRPGARRETMSVVETARGGQRGEPFQFINDLGFVGDSAIYVGQRPDANARVTLVLGGRSSAEFSREFHTLKQSADGEHFVFMVGSRTAGSKVLIDGFEPTATGFFIPDWCAISEKGETVALLEQSSATERKVVLFSGGKRSDVPLPLGALPVVPPVLAPDGSQWAVVCAMPKRGTDGQIAVIWNNRDVTGGTFGTLALPDDVSRAGISETASVNASLKFSPDGKSLAFVAHEPARRDRKHVVLNGVAFGPYGFVTAPTFDSDGSLTFSARRPAEGSPLLRVRLRPDSVKASDLAEVARQKEEAEATRLRERAASVPTGRPEPALGAIATDGAPRLRVDQKVMGLRSELRGTIVFSRIGDRVAFARNAGDLRRQDQGGKEIEVASTELIVDGRAVFDGDRAANIRFSDDSSTWIANVFGYAKVKGVKFDHGYLVNGQEVSVDGRDSEIGVISPDGKRLAFWTTRRSREGATRILIVDGQEVYAIDDRKLDLGSRFKHTDPSALIRFSEDSARYAAWVQLKGSPGGAVGEFIIDGKAAPVRGQPCGWLGFVDSKIGFAAQILTSAGLTIWSERGLDAPISGSSPGMVAAISSPGDVLWAGTPKGGDRPPELFSIGTTSDLETLRGQLVRGPYASPNGAHYAAVLMADEARGIQRLVHDGRVVAQGMSIGPVAMSEDGAHVAAGALSLELQQPPDPAEGRFSATPAHVLLLDGDAVRLPSFAAGEPPSISPCGRHASAKVAVNRDGMTLFANVINGVAEPARDEVHPVVFSPRGESTAYFASDRGRWILVINGQSTPAGTPISVPVRADSLASMKQPEFAVRQPVFLSERVVRAFVERNGEIVRLDIAIEGEIAPRPSLAEQAAQQKLAAASDRPQAPRRGTASDSGNAAGTESDQDQTQDSGVDNGGFGVNAKELEKQLQEASKALEKALQDAAKNGGFGGLPAPAPQPTPPNPPAPSGPSKRPPQGKPASAAEIKAFHGTWKVRGRDAKGKEVGDTIEIADMLVSSRAGQFDLGEVAYAVRKAADLVVLTAESEGDGFTMRWRIELDGDELVVEETLDRLGKVTTIELRGTRSE